MKTLYILQGIPASGKSTLARALELDLMQEGCRVYSTDDYWGVDYDHDCSKLAQAHAWNRARVAQAMHEGILHIIVDNTNLDKKSWEPYLLLAQEYNYTPQFIRCEVSLETALARNSKRSTHRQVPDKTITKMYNRFRNLPPLL